MQMQELNGIMMCETNIKSIAINKRNGALKYHFENKQDLNKAINFINIAFNKVVYSVFNDNDLLIVNC